MADLGNATSFFGLHIGSSGHEHPLFLSSRNYG
jgi:hypothetical protein